MSKAKTTDQDGLLDVGKKTKNKQQLADDDSSGDGDFAEPKQKLVEPELPEQIEDENLKVPSIANLNVCQWIIIAILYIAFALLVSFIIYISATWQKDRTNEYT